MLRALEVDSGVPGALDGGMYYSEHLPRDENLGVIHHDVLHIIHGGSRIFTVGLEVCISTEWIQPRTASVPIQPAIPHVIEAAELYL